MAVLFKSENGKLRNFNDFLLRYFVLLFRSAKSGTKRNKSGTLSGTNPSAQPPKSGHEHNYPNKLQGCLQEGLQG
jgi:hypothetical protein